MNNSKINDFINKEYSKFKEMVNKYDDSVYYDMVKPLLNNLNEDSMIKVAAYTVMLDRITNSDEETKLNRTLLEIYLFEQYQTVKNTYEWLLNKESTEDMEIFEKICNFY